MNKTKTDERQHTTGQLVQDGHQDKEKIDRQIEITIVVKQKKQKNCTFWDKRNGE